MNAQRRRLATTTNSNTTLNAVSADNLQIDLDETNATNMHGLRYCFSIEPEVGEANANGFWAVFCLPSGVIQNSDLPNLIGEMGDDSDWSPYLWGLGCWTASNQAPYHGEFNPGTSRNCQKGARVIAYVIKEGISSGAVRIIQTLTGFTN